MYTQLLTSKLYRPPAARRHGAAVWPGGPAAISRCALWRGRHPTVGRGGAPCSPHPPPGPRPGAPPQFCRRRAPSRPPERPRGSAAPPRRRPTRRTLSAAGPAKDSQDDIFTGVVFSQQILPFPGQCCGSGFTESPDPAFQADIFFWSKIPIYLSLGLLKGRPSYRRSLQSSKENIQHFKKWNLLTFYTFLWVIFTQLARIHNSAPAFFR